MFFLKTQFGKVELNSFDTFNSIVHLQKSILLSPFWNPNVTSSCQSEPERMKKNALDEDTILESRVELIRQLSLYGSPTKRAF